MWLRMANKIQCIKNVTQFSVKSKHNNWLSNHRTYLLIITLAPSPIPSKIPHILFEIISLDVDTVRFMTRTQVWLLTLEHSAKCHNTISWIMSSYFSWTGASTDDNLHNCAPTTWGNGLVSLISTDIKKYLKVTRHGAHLLVFKDRWRDTVLTH